jgi:hypothetical protein
VQLLSLFGAIAILSIVFVRRRIYEFFLATHFLASVALLILLWIHIRQLSLYMLTCLWASLGVLMTQKTLWLIYYCYRNIGSAPGSRASVKVYPCSTPDETILQLEINVKRPWKLLPGQYVHLCLPSSRLLGAGLLESHPFMIAWAAHDDRERLKTITILARSRTGFTRHLNVQNNMARAILDGPYGGNETGTLIKHDTILLISSGIGLASHLNTARYLLLAHNAQTARLRRLTLVWSLDLPGIFTPPPFILLSNLVLDQIVWAGKFLKMLKEIDYRKIVVLYLFVPGEDADAAPVQDAISGIDNAYAHTTTLHFADILEQEWNAEAGSMLVSGKRHSRKLVQRIF